MLLDKLTKYLQDEGTDFSYVRDDPRMEIWVKDREQLPILVSQINRQKYIIYWENLDYEVMDEEKAYRYTLRIFSSIKDKKSL